MERTNVVETEGVRLGSSQKMAMKEKVEKLGSGDQ